MQYTYKDTYFWTSGVARDGDDKWIWRYNDAYIDKNVMYVKLYE